tara:strand:- start:254 stop:1060 length:807 start_codon:yes stop_codon:yes gene_type:complete
MILRASLLVAIIAAAIAFGSGSATAEGVAPTVKHLKNTSPTHVLFVGNSYLYYGDSVHNHVRRMAVAAGAVDAEAVKYKLATISGSALYDHNIDSYILGDKLRVGKPFDVVILQGGSAVGWSKKRPAEFAATVAEFSKKITAAGGETALYMTQAYVPPHKRYDPDMTATLARIYTEVGNDTGALVIPVGLAFAEAYRQRPDLQLHKSFDGSHPDFIGTYLAAATVFASVYGQSPVGIDYDYFGKIDKDTARFLQEVAQKTVTEYYGRE